MTAGFILTALFLLLLIGAILWGMKYIGISEMIYRIAVVVAVIGYIFWIATQLGFVHL